MIRPSLAVKYYSRRDVQEALLKFGRDREVVPNFNGQEFGKRPSILFHEKEVISLVKKGATSFHASEERWLNPLALDLSMGSKQMNDLRIGWDLVIDVDTKNFDHAKRATSIILDALEAHNVKNYALKFSGNNGFHIAIAYEAFPTMISGIKTSNLFPEVPRTIAGYMTELLEPHLKKELGTHDVKIDTVFLASRHLLRMPYSLHEKSGMASVTIDRDELMDFKKEYADPEKVEVREYMKNPIKEEAKPLVWRAYRWKAEQEQKEIKTKRIIEKPVKAVSEESFPPCIKLMSMGVKDGRKRASFALTNFLRSVNWDYEMIDEYLTKWNERNEEQLRLGYIKSQLKWHKRLKGDYLPPNCKTYYEDLGVCKPDNLCERIKNPVAYAIRNEYNKLRGTKRNTKGNTKERRTDKTA